MEKIDAGCKGQIWIFIFLQDAQTLTWLFPRNRFCCSSVMFDVVLTAWHFRDIRRDDWKACSGNNASHWSLQSLSHENQVCCFSFHILGCGWPHTMPIWSVAWQWMDGSNILNYVALQGYIKRISRAWHPATSKGVTYTTVKTLDMFLLIFKLKWFIWEQEVGFK